MPYLVIKNQDTFTKFSILSRFSRFDSLGIATCKLPYTKISILKILFTNFCINNCKYCAIRNQNDIRRTSFTPEELANFVLELHTKGLIKGLFLSSGIGKNPDDTMERMIKSIEILRKKFDYKGYVHLKILPGTSKELIKKAVTLADRVSCNLELPTNKSLAFWAPEKKKAELIKILSLITKNFLENEKQPSVSTQLIIGASRDSDKTILKLADSLYKSKIVKRVYYSAYIPVNQDPELPEIKEPPVLREYRLYQADKLIREYRFSISELFSCSENLSLDRDPKLAWAFSHPEFFPVDLARADYFELLRIPGIGPQTARKILALRKDTPLNEYTLRKLGLPLEKISKFITIKGKTMGRLFENELFPQIKTENLSGLQCNNSLFAGSYRSF